MRPIELRAVDVLVPYLGTLSLVDMGLDGTPSVYPRALDGTDENFSIGVYFNNWAPTDTPLIGSNEPTMGKYTFHVQTYLKSDVRTDGEQWNVALAKRIRQLLYRDPGLRIALGTLNEADDYTVERVMRFGIVGVEYADAAITGGFAYLSQTEFFLETEVT